MTTSVVLFVMLFVACHAIPSQYYLVRLDRPKRQTTKFDVSKQPNGGTRLTLGQEGSIDLGNNHISGGGFFSKQFNPKGPTTFGSNLDFQNAHSGSQLHGSLTKTPHFGTDLSVDGSQVLYHNGNGYFEATGGVHQHFGGLPGTGHPDVNVGINFKYVPQLTPDLERHICMMTSGIQSRCQ